ncbi:MAG: glycerophosphodiester phosphodiesterase family protein [Candidatus Woesearchaeota archaeon]
MMTIVIAHRGASAYHTENTISALKEAVYQKADKIEVDVRLTKDKVPILFHDASLLRLANRKTRLSKTSYSHLKSIKIRNNERITSLEEFLGFAKNKILVVLDLKELGGELKIINLINKQRMEKDVIISSRNIHVLKKIKKVNPNIKVALIFRFRRKAVLAAKKIGAYSVHPHHLSVTRWLVRLAHENNLKIFPFTVNRSKRMKQLLHIGVDGLITDKPVLLRNVIRQMAKHPKN